MEGLELQRKDNATGRAARLRLGWSADETFLGASVASRTLGVEGVERVAAVLLLGRLEWKRRERWVVELLGRLERRMS